jgi:cytochrome c556
MFRQPALLVGAALLALGSAAAAAVPMSVKEEMKQVVEPGSNTLFAVGGDADPTNGPPPPKIADARWKEAATAAQALKNVAATLNDKGRAKPGADWATFVKQMNDTSAAALKAANAKDGAGLSTAANALSDTCSSCHAKYKPQTAG